MSSFFTSTPGIITMSVGGAVLLIGGGCAIYYFVFKKEKPKEQDRDDNGQSNNNDDNKKSKGNDGKSNNNNISNSPGKIDNSPNDSGNDVRINSPKINSGIANNRDNTETEPDVINSYVPMFSGIQQQKEIRQQQEQEKNDNCIVFSDWKISDIHWLPICKEKLSHIDPLDKKTYLSTLNNIGRRSIATFPYRRIALPPPGAEEIFIELMEKNNVPINNESNVNTVIQGLLKYIYDDARAFYSIGAVMGMAQTTMDHDVFRLTMQNIVDACKKKRSGKRLGTLLAIIQQGYKNTVNKVFLQPNGIIDFLRDDQRKFIYTEIVPDKQSAMKSLYSFKISDLLQDDCFNDKVEDLYNKKQKIVANHKTRFQYDLSDYYHDDPYSDLEY